MESADKTKFFKAQILQGSAHVHRLERRSRIEMQVVSLGGAVFGMLAGMIAPYLAGRVAPIENLVVVGIILCIFFFAAPFWFPKLIKSGF